MNRGSLIFAVAFLVVAPFLRAQVQEEWVRRYVGPNGSDRPWAIQSDNAGNVYVTGSSLSTNDIDFLTLKYAADGTLQWAARYNGTATNSLDFAQALAVDESGDVYVLGASDNGTGMMRLTLVKYGPSGNQIWVVQYLQGGDVEPIAVVARNNAIYVAGSVNFPATAWDYLTLKYDSNGNLLWEAPFNETGQSQDTLAGITLDGAGNIVVTGTSLSGAPGGANIITLKYSPNGSTLWTNVPAALSEGHYGQARAVAVDATGHIYVGGQVVHNSSLDYGVLKLDADGHELWTAAYAGPLNVNDTMWGMALDNAGNVLLTGISASSHTFEDYVTVKVDATGNVRWAARYSGAGDSAQDTPSSIAVDGAGNAYVTGYSAIDNGPFSFATVKYDPNGNQVWVARYNALGGFDAATDLTLDANENVLVTGLSTDPNTGEDIVTIKYTQSVVAGLPQITSPPQSLEAIAGTNVTFEVTATGNAPLSYQWRFMGAPLAGETNPTLVIENVSTSRAGDYSVIVSNSAGFTVSPEARLAVFQPPLITAPWVNLFLVVGSPAFLASSAIGDGPLWFQWQFNGADLPGETNIHLLLFNLNTNDTGNYSLVVTNLYGRDEKVLAAITVRPPDTLDRWYWRHPLPQGNDLRDIAYGNGRFVAVGQGGTILVSSDGLTWTNQSVQWNDLGGIAFGNGLFVAVGYGGGLLTSPDGEHWTKPTVPNPAYPRDFLDVAFGNGRFVVVGSAVLVSSADGVHWQEWYGGRDWFLWGAAYEQGKFLVYPTSPGIVFTGTDGINWSTNAMTPSDLAILTVASGNGSFVGTDGGRTLYLSPEGLNWTNRFSGDFRDLAFANNTFVAVGNGIAHSSDGVAWGLDVAQTTNFLLAVTYGNGKFVAVGSNGAILTSADGSSWTEVGGGSPNNLRGIAKGPSGFVAVGNMGAVWTSADGFVWTSLGSIGIDNLRAIAFGTNTFVVVGDDGAIFTSPNGTIWTAQNAATNSFFGLHYGNGHFVAVGDDGIILVSADGVSWVKGNSGTSVRLQGITFQNGLYVATGRSGAILTSTDALTWTSRPSPTGQYLESVTGNTNLFVAVGHNGVIVVSLDGITWGRQTSGITWDMESVVFADGMFVVVGDRGRVITSPNGGDWLSRVTGCYTALRNVIYADGAFWAAGNNETILKSGQTRPFLSAWLAPNEFNVRIEAELGKAHRLQTSSNLADWSDLFNFTPEEPSTFYRDTPSDKPHQFYRVISP